ncbi:MAG: tRNA pseudouridine(38-40) synthase TruA [Chthoniobacterales bacterium]
MSHRLKLIVGYHGSHFAGWQSQGHGNTVQDELERAFQTISGKGVRVHGAGRTDAGVHALGQCAHVDLSDRNLSAERWLKAANAILPPTIRVLRCSFVPDTFHARLSAKGKVYRYRIWSAPVLPPLEYGRAWHIPSPLNLANLQAAVELFVGKHNFAAFAANRGKPETNTVRTINSVRVQRRDASVTIDFDGDGFLYKMVRLMVGTIAQCALGKISPEEIRKHLSSPGAEAQRFVAPAEGLFLVRVRY